MTGLPNRLLLAERFRLGIARYLDGDRILVVAYLDLDGFKEINDRFGHKKGDEILIVLAERMTAVLGDDDTPARIGGGEFVIVITGARRTEDCFPILTRLLGVVSAPLSANDVEIRVSASVGVALCPRDGAVADLLIRRADQAMYRAKREGRN